MKRAVLMGTNAFPYLAFYQAKLMREVWADEVDKIYIAVSQPVYPSVFNYVRKVLQLVPNVEVIHTQTDWPESINRVAQTIDADSLLVMHDDTLIYKKGVVDHYFKEVEKTGKVYTPIHGNYSGGQFTEELIMRKYGDQMPIVCEEQETKGYSFFSFFLFMPMSLFNKTSKRFDTFYVAPDQYCELLDFKPRVNGIGADTDFLLNLELLNAGAHYVGIPEYNFTRLYNLPNPLEAFNKILEKRENPFVEGAGYMHIQTMAYHIGGLFWDLGEREALTIQRGDDVGPKSLNMKDFRSDPMHRWTLIFRLAWIREFMTALDDFGGIQKFHDHAITEIEYIKRYFRLKQSYIDEIQTKLHNYIWKGAI